MGGRGKHERVKERCRKHKKKKRKKRQIKLIEMKGITSEMTLDGRNCRLDIEEVEISELKYTTIETIPTKTERKQKQKKNYTLVSYGMTSSSLIYM